MLHGVIQNQMSTYHIANERDWFPLPQVWHAINPKQATPTPVEDTRPARDSKHRRTDKIFELRLQVVSKYAQMAGAILALFLLLNLISTVHIYMALRNIIDFFFFFMSKF